METGSKPAMQHYAVHLLKYWKDENGNRILPFNTILHSALCLGFVANRVHEDYGMIGPKERPIDTLVDTLLECLESLTSKDIQWNITDEGRMMPVSPFESGTYEDHVFISTYTFIEKYL